MKHPMDFGGKSVIALAVIAMTVLAAVLLAVYAGARLRMPANGQPQAGTMLSQPRPLGEFELTGDDGKPFTLAQLRGRWSLLFAGYTHCPDVCPTTLGFLKDLDARLRADNKPGQVPVQIIFVSVDPERDTPQRLAQYLHAFSPRFIGATARGGALEHFTARLGVVHAEAPGAEPGHYGIDHSAVLILVNPRAEIAGYFTPPLKLDAIAAGIAAAMAHFS